MVPPTPSRRFLAAQVRWAMGRGLPPQVAEDVVFAAWERAQQGFDPARGSFEAYMQRIVRRDCAGWWRRQGVQRRAHDGLRLVPDPPAAAEVARAEACQQQLLEALQPDERAVFATWALQRHLGKGRLSAADAGASIGLEPRAYDNAKRRLKARLHALMERFGWSLADLIPGGRHADRAS
jgi:DNA-directed RNA polymerase specialized sigma24 family protein